MPLSRGALMRQSWVRHWRDRLWPPHSEVLTVSQCLSVCLSLLHTHTPAHSFTHIPLGSLKYSTLSCCFSVCKIRMSPPASQAANGTPMSLRFALLGSGLHPQHSQGKWAESNQDSRYPWGARSWLQGVEGAPEMPVCLPGCWLPGQTENSLSWVRMWTLLGVCDFNQTF